MHPFDIPMLRNSVPYNGRAACMRCRWCVGFACEVDAKNGTQNTVIPEALASGNCELRAECVVKEILTDHRGRATGVAYFDSQDRLEIQPADLVVASCGATETARLLLNSQSNLYPQGLGNRHDWVGRNLQGHGYAGLMVFSPMTCMMTLAPARPLPSPISTTATRGMVGGGALCNEFIRLPIHFSSMTPPDLPRWGKAHKDFMRQGYRRTAVVMGPAQEMPMFDSRVQVDPRVKDFWGIPVVRLSG